MANEVELEPRYPRACKSYWDEEKPARKNASGDLLEAAGAISAERHANFARLTPVADTCGEAATNTPSNYVCTHGQAMVPFSALPAR
jgi:hypothetical protein